jgi:hypothetical protein
MDPEEFEAFAAELVQQPPGESGTSCKLARHDEGVP